MIDFHCHLDLYSDPAAVRDECEKRGLYILSVTTTPSAWEKTAALAVNAQRVRTALGLHPQLAHQRMGELALFDELLPGTRYVGEIGLDGSPEFRSQWQSQRETLEHILMRCSDAGGRVMSIHSRRASGEVLNVLEAFPNAGTAVLHWFSGSVRDLNRAISLGCWFSVGPGMLAGQRGRSLVTRMPRERVLTESDGPFAQVDGKSIMPWSVEGAVRDLGRLWNLSEESAEQVVRDNFRKLCAE
ncbi:MAG: TatD family hydrolase [Acidobacteriia bacterium]|nr:TatD family hydrolase [Terriglobia bacterium]